MGKDSIKTKLPPERYFQLSHIISHSKTIQQDLQNLNDSFVNTIDLYNKDVCEQLVQSVKVENELIDQLRRVNDAYNIVHNIRSEDITDSQINNNTRNTEDEITSSNSNKHSKSSSRSLSMFGISSNKNEKINKFEILDKIDSNMEGLLNETVVQKKRLDTMISRLKKIELNLPKRERLYNEKSVNKIHYFKLYNYGMKRSKGVEAERIPKPVEVIKPGKIVARPVETKIKRQARKSDCSNISRVSQQKLNQYLSIENELEEIKKVKSIESAISSSTAEATKGFNPIFLVSNKADTSTPCKISNESITVRADINTLRKNSLKNENATSLVDELKKLYRK